MSAQQLKLTTTGTPATVVIQDLGGKTFVHPVTGFDLLGEFSRDELFNSSDLQTSVTGAEVTLADQDGNAVTNVKDYLWAQGIRFNPTPSGMAATNVQAAIEELKGQILEETYTETFGRDREVVTNVWLDRVGGMPGNVSPYRVPFTGKLVKILCSTRDAETYDAEVFKQPYVRSGGVPLDANKLAEVAVSAANSGTSGVLAVTVTAGDDIGVFIRGTGASYPTVTLVFVRTA